MQGCMHAVRRGTEGVGWTHASLNAVLELELWSSEATRTTTFAGTGAFGAWSANHTFAPIIHLPAYSRYMHRT